MEEKRSISILRPSLGMLFALILAILPTGTRTVEAAEAFQWHSIEKNEDFQPIRAHLQHLVDSDAITKINHLCVVGQKQSGRYVNAYVYWPTMGKLILWEPNRDTLDDIAMSRRYLDLKADVVEGHDVHGSSYQVTRSWATTVIRACRQHGKTMTIVKGNPHGRRTSPGFTAANVK